MQYLIAIIMTSWFFYFCDIALASEEYIHFVEQMEINVGEIIHKKYGLNTVGTGGKLMNNISSLNLYFEHEGILSKDQLRTMLVEITNFYLNEINNNTKIRPYLNVFPFTPKEIEIAIYIENQNDEVFLPDIAVGDSYNNKVNFRYIEKALGPYKQIDTETFEEAETIVSSQK